VATSCSSTDCRWPTNSTLCFFFFGFAIAFSPDPHTQKVEQENLWPFIANKLGVLEPSTTCSALPDDVMITTRLAKLYQEYCMPVEVEHRRLEQALESPRDPINSLEQFLQPPGTDINAVTGGLQMAAYSTNPADWDEVSAAGLGSGKAESNEIIIVAAVI
jgi:hypothetical protein